MPDRHVTTRRLARAALVLLVLVLLAGVVLGAVVIARNVPSAWTLVPPTAISSGFSVTPPAPVPPTAVPASPTAPPASKTPSPNQPPLAITFVDRDCFLIVSGETKILTDASEIVPPGAWQRIAQVQPPFDDVDLLLSTHEHGDHFDAALTRAYLERNPNGIFVSTQATVDLLQKSYPAFEEVRDRVKAFEPGEGERIKVTLNGIDLEVLNLPHGWPITNLGFIMHIGGWKVLHTGDVSAGIAFHQEPGSNGVDFLRSYGVADEGIDVALVHYNFITMPEFRTKAGGNMMLDTIRARWVVPMGYDFTSLLMHDVFRQLKTRCPDCIVFHEVLETQILR